MNIQIYMSCLLARIEVKHPFLFFQLFCILLLFLRKKKSIWKYAPPKGRPWLNTGLRVIWQDFNHELLYDPLTCNMTSLLTAPHVQMIYCSNHCCLDLSLSTLTFIRSLKWLLCDGVRSGSLRILLCDPGNARSRLADEDSLTRGDCVIHLGKYSTDVLIRQRRNPMKAVPWRISYQWHMATRLWRCLSLSKRRRGMPWHLGEGFWMFFPCQDLCITALPAKQSGQITHGQSIVVTNNLDAHVLIDTSFNKPAWVDLNKIPPLISMLYH